MPQIVIKFDAKSFQRHVEVVSGESTYPRGDRAVDAADCGELSTTDEQFGVLEQILHVGVVVTLDEAGHLEAYIPAKP